MDAFCISYCLYFRKFTTVFVYSIICDVKGEKMKNIKLREAEKYDIVRDYIFSSIEKREKNKAFIVKHIIDGKKENVITN